MTPLILVIFVACLDISVLKKQKNTCVKDHNKTKIMDGDITCMFKIQTNTKLLRIIYL
jgi:hypothetical protein